MAATVEPGVLAHIAGLLGDIATDTAGGDRRGAVWRLEASGRQLDANLVRMAPGASVAGHVEADLDVLLYVAGGSGHVDTGSGPQPVSSGDVVWLPHGTRRSTRAGDGGLVYLSVHRRRPGLTVRPAPERGGEPACRLDRVCPECGRMAVESDARFCTRCGSELP